MSNYSTTRAAITSTAATADEERTQTTVTPYGAYKMVNAVLAQCGLKSIPPQMMYNYTTAQIRAGKKPLIECDADGRITRDALIAWLRKYLTKKGVNVA